MTWLTADPPAKLNLFLEVTARRDDGYHDLDTVFLAVDWRDRLRIRPRDDDQIHLHVTRQEGDWTEASGTPELPSIPTDDRNLVVAALRAFGQQFGGPPGWDAELTKSIPAGAGMGGASSDAASAMLLAAQHAGMDRQQLNGIALQIGSDVPFFISGHVAAHATGRGERLTGLPVGDPNVGLVVVYPAAEISTGGIFGRCIIPQTPMKSLALRTMLADGHWNQLGGQVVNRLQVPAVGGCPRLEQALGWLHSNTAQRWWMTGSGSACFCIAGSPADGRSLADRLRRDCPLAARIRWVCPMGPAATRNHQPVA